MKPRTEPRRAKLPPLLEIDEDGVPVSDLAAWGHPRWMNASEGEGVQLDEWPTEFDD